MKHESELITAANEGFRKWLTNEEIIAHVSAERARVARAPTLYLTAFESKQGYIKFEASVVKLTKEVDETGKLLDVELHVVNDEITEPIKIMTSVFQPGAHAQIQFCRIFATEKDRDNYYEDIRFLADLNNVYKQSMIELMRRQLGF
jgi:hypothetical protein